MPPLSASFDHDIKPIVTLFEKAPPEVWAHSLDCYGDLLLRNFSDDFLDRVMELMLSTISAKILVALLVTSKRLEYDDQCVASDEGKASF